MWIPHTGRNFWYYVLHRAELLYQPANSNIHKTESSYNKPQSRKHDLDNSFITHQHDPQTKCYYTHKFIGPGAYRY